MRVMFGTLLALASYATLAHEVRPAFLHLTEIERGVFEVLWKQPVMGDRRLALEPLLPEDCTVVAE